MRIEDDDSFIQQEGLDPIDEGDEGGRSHTVLLYIIVIAAWLLWSVGCFLLFRGRMASAIEESGVLSLIESRSNGETAAVTTRMVSLVYPFADGTSITINVEAPRYGGSVYHDTVEALISTYPYEALSYGAISLVPQDTELVGLTARDGICYVELDGPLAEAPTLAGYTAYDQIADTLRLFDTIEKIVIIDDRQNSVISVDS